MSGRRARLARKGARVIRRELQSEFDVALGEARARRDKQLVAANEAFRKGIDELRGNQREARAKAYAEYDEARDEIVKNAAREAAA